MASLKTFGILVLAFTINHVIGQPESPTESQNQMREWERIGNVFFMEQNWDSAYFYLEKVWMEAEVLSIWKTYGYSGAGMASTRYRVQDFECMETILKESLNGVEKFGDESTKEVIPILLNLMGVLYQKIGDYEQGLAVAQKSLELNLSLKNAPLEEIATVYNNLGIFYGRTGDYQKAIAYYEKSLSIRLEQNLSPL